MNNRKPILKLLCIYSKVNFFISFYYRCFKVSSTTDWTKYASFLFYWMGMGRGGVHGVGVVVGGGGCCAKMCMSKTTSHSYLAGKLVIRRLYLHGIFASFKFWPACDPFCSISDQRNP
jgi:hypothetical protein